MLNQAHPPWSQGILAIKLSQKQLPEALLLFSLKEDAEMVMLPDKRTTPFRGVTKIASREHHISQSFHKKYAQLTIAATFCPNGRSATSQLAPRNNLWPPLLKGNNQSKLLLPNYPNYSSWWQSNCLTVPIKSPAATTHKRSSLSAEPGWAWGEAEEVAHYLGNNFRKESVDFGEQHR